MKPQVPPSARQLREPALQGTKVSKDDAKIKAMPLIQHEYKFHLPAVGTISGITPYATYSPNTKRLCPHLEATMALVCKKAAALMSRPYFVTVIPGEVLWVADPLMQ